MARAEAARKARKRKAAATRSVSSDGGGKGQPKRGAKNTGKSGFLHRARRFLWCASTSVVLCVVFATIVPVAVLRFVHPPTSAFMLHSRVADPATGRSCKRIEYRWAPWRAISRDIPRAVLVAEDQRFLMHNGFDTRAIGDAVSELAAGGRMRGASTISQQVAKNLFLWPERSLLRKGLEAWFTVWIELLWPKRRIVEVYVNIAQFGPCVFGAEAASRLYFGHGAARVTALEAARLAAVLPAPGQMRVDAPGPYADQRAEEIRAEMQRGGGPAYLRGL